MKKSYSFSDLQLKLNLDNIMQNREKSLDFIQTSNDWLRSKEQIYKNLIIISLAWLLQFTAFQSMANLQSSLNSDEGLGTASLSTIYLALVISCLLVPPIMIEKLGLKLTIISSQFTYLLFIAANMYPRWHVLIPAAVLLGIGAAPLWTAKCTYLTEIAECYSKLTNESNESVVNRFFGIFFSVFQFSQIIGNLLSSLVLKPPESIKLKNATTIYNLDLCGSNDCPSDSTSLQASSSPKIVRPKTSTVYMLCFVYLSLMLSSILLIMFCLKNLTNKKNIKKSISENKFSLLISTIKNIKNLNQILLIPLTLWLGFSLAFIGADFTKSFVACAKGVDSVGYAMIYFGLANAFGSFLFGQLAKYLSRFVCLSLAGCLNYLTIFIMMSWKLKKEEEYMLNVIAMLWGVSDSIWQTQVNSLYGVLFSQNQEAAFSNFRLWESLGFFVSYFYSSWFCLTTKLYLLLGYLTCGMLGYFMIELNEMKYFNKRSILFKFKCHILTLFVLSAFIVWLRF